MGSACQEHIPASLCSPGGPQGWGGHGGGAASAVWVSAVHSAGREMSNALLWPSPQAAKFSSDLCFSKLSRVPW